MDSKCHLSYVTFAFLICHLWVRGQPKTLDIGDRRGPVFYWAMAGTILSSDTYLENPLCFCFFFLFFFLCVLSYISFLFPEVELTYSIILVLGVQQNDSVIFFRLYAIVGIIRYQIKFPMLYSEPLLLIYFMYSSLHLLIIYFYFILPFPLVTINEIFYVILSSVPGKH